MKIKTAYKIKCSADPRYAQLIIEVFLNGHYAGTVMALSGQKVDIDDFVAGEITWEELSKRWGID